jgi:hypothetical protein
MSTAQINTIRNEDELKESSWKILLIKKLTTQQSLGCLAKVLSGISLKLEPQEDIGTR